MKKFLSAVLTACMLTVLVTGCGSSTGTGTTSQGDGSQAQNSQAAVDEKGTHKVTDQAGNTVEVPNKITRVVIDQIPILSTYMSYFKGSAPYIVGYCGSFKDTITKTVLKDIAPELMKSSDTVYAQSDLNIEEIMKLNPDVILYNANNASHAQILKESGIPSIGFATVGASTDADPIDRYQQWLELLEDVFNEDGKMNDFKSAGNAIVADVEKRIAAVPQDKRPSAMILWKYSDGVPQVSGNGTFGTFWLKRLGVKDVVVDEAKGFTQVNMEQVYRWDPDILFLDGPGLLSLRTADVIENRVQGTDFSTLSAVKNKRVYDTTLGMWNWFTPNPDAPLVYAWLACKTYPEVFADYPLEQTIKDYYQKWYSYTVTDADMAEMLQY
ncbi:ABC transporter substrate-binding protein [[Bacteroides] pectinophilus]|uniref:Fe/B12 periplasmic-binding domain-containing protein n=1 Tax=[Bacteroides] pectinophilus ATCC 43243 TaxID=483218 RepID=B7AUV0_9FIRM|nr:periplasmic binding protein [[Bacteroides] pectinophilus ATCC 43243]UWN95924.1 ABC transporter substrate-binding protein [[Bacteroides] pectinophilus]